MTHVFPQSFSTNLFKLIVIIRCFIDIATQQIDKGVAVARGYTNEQLSSGVPIAAPKNISRTARSLGRGNLLLPTAAQRFVELDQRQQLVSSGLRQAQLCVE